VNKIDLKTKSSKKKKNEEFYLINKKNKFVGYIFWSCIGELPSKIFYYPLNELQFTGKEGYLLFMLLPILLFNDKIFHTVIKYHHIFQLISLVGLLSYYTTRIEYQIFLLTFSTCGQLTLNMALWFHSRTRMERNVCGLMLSLISVVSINFLKYSLNPIWSSSIVNMNFVVTGSLSCFILSQEHLISTLHKQSNFLPSDQSLNKNKYYLLDKIKIGSGK
jgi:hypothetical protein